ncbi:MAG: hypothetical protein WDO70_02955 [Alphaproteobacteria bacterium]
MGDSSNFHEAALRSFRHGMPEDNYDDESSYPDYEKIREKLEQRKAKNAALVPVLRHQAKQQGRMHDYAGLSETAKQMSALIWRGKRRELVADFVNAAAILTADPAYAEQGLRSLLNAAGRVPEKGEINKRRQIKKRAVLAVLAHHGDVADVGNRIEIIERAIPQALASGEPALGHQLAEKLFDHIELTFNCYDRSGRLESVIGGARPGSALHTDSILKLLDTVNQFDVAGGQPSIKKMKLYSIEFAKNHALPGSHAARCAEAALTAAMEPAKPSSRHSPSSAPDWKLD